MASSKEQFQTIRTQGAILPVDVLQRINAQELDGLSPEDYHLPPTVKPNEAISQSWSRVLSFWKAFSEARDKTPESDETGGLITRDRWLLPLFQELGYGRLTKEKAPEIEGKTYPIERFWNAVPLHLVGFKLSMDRRAKGVRGAATASPHSLIQEFLNRSDDHLWAFVSNGLQLRILRDNLALSRQSYVEFDLEAMMEGEVYADFAMLWLLCHQSRLEADKPEECWLEKWSKVAQEQGTRILSDLRDGVTRAIEALGTGFIAHRRNDHLRQKLESGELSTQDYYRQLLRIVYRLLFLFVAEDRELLHPPDADEKACSLYDKYYSTRQLRELASSMRGSKHADLWHILSLVCESLAKPGGSPELGLPGLGSFLWAQDSTPDLLGPSQSNDEPSVLIRNEDLLLAIRSLGFVERDRSLRIVDYRNLGSEELGSVYESLLELVPDVELHAKAFSLRTAAGNERKTTGSYYTPDSLVQCLLDSALDPIMEDRLKEAAKKARADNSSIQEAQEQAILDIKVCDPAVGSGHFLIAAAHRLARQLARVRTGETEPTPEDHQHALRDVIRRCVYGVDINPMSAELCKVALWMESIEPGKPLSFLDAHIQVGNSLLGTTPRLLSEGIPDDAFKPIEGDVKTVVTDLKKQNKKERKDKKSAMDYLFEPTIKLGNLPAEWVKISDAADDSVADVATKERRYAELVSGSDYQNARLLADTWCAVFVWQKDKSDLGQNCPTEREFRRIEANPHSILPGVKAEVRRLAEQYQFFHWHLAFPDVFVLPEQAENGENEQTGWSRGFDVVLGNPPWERINLEAKQFFATIRPDIASASTSKRNKLITALELEEPALFAAYADAQRIAGGELALAQRSGLYPHLHQARLNTYVLFVELKSVLLSRRGRAGMIVPSGVATDDNCRHLFRYLTESNRLVSLYDFENREALFAGVHRSYKFSLLTIAAGTAAKPADFAFFLHRIGDLADESKHFALTTDDLSLLSPITGLCPTFRNKRDQAVVLQLHRNIPPFIKQKNENEAWTNSDYLIMFRSASSSHIYKSSSDFGEQPLNSMVDAYPQIKGEIYLPLWESKLLHQFDHRYATFDGVIEEKVVAGKARELTLSEKAHAAQVLPRTWVPTSEVQRILTHRDWSYQWTMGYRDITNATNERTAIASVLPNGGACQPLNLFLPESPDYGVAWLAAFGSFVLDYISRQSIGGVHLNITTCRQLPIPGPDRIPHNISQFIRSRVLDLTYTAWDLEAFALDCGYSGPPFRWNEQRRFLLRCELDAAYFHLYLGSPEDWGKDSPQLREMFPTPRDAVDYIMDTFPIVKKKDIKRTQVKNDAGEVTTEGTYITKDTILAIYDEMQTAIETGQPYQTHLNPPPGPPADAEGNFIPMSEWDPDNWPEHIHQPRESEAVRGSHG